MALPLPGGTDPDLGRQAKFDTIALEFPVKARFFEAPITALPAAAQDGQVITYTADATNGVNWLFRYRSASGSSYKWESVGGPPLVAFVDTDELRNPAAFGALATAGPSITVPLAGDYIVEVGSSQYNDVANQSCKHSYDVGGTGALDADGAGSTPSFANVENTPAMLRRKTGLAASTALVSKYHGTGTGNAHFRQRWMRVTPIRVG